MRMPIAPLTMLALLASVGGVSIPAQAQLTVSSPDHRNVVTLETRDGGLYYRVDRDGRALLLPSRLGVRLSRRAPAVG